MSFSPVPSYVFGTIFTGIGLLSVLAPATDYAVFGLPLEASTSSSTGAVSPMTYAKGIRDLAFGLTYFGLQYYGLDFAITIFSAVLCVVALGDGLVVYKYGGPLSGKAFGHWGGFVPFVAWVAWRAQYAN
ncbi:hypothetical protein SEUCBS139899_006755 [Sporothrix eucalyptigena]|uniref:Integral membrane protein n=1 Tax=Sporothrix eucalyptigena TaxID=1812306 RepID=A0ABP0CHH6_9PEZI